MSRGEFDNVARALGGWEKMVNPNAKDKQTLALLEALIDWQKEDKLFENQQLLRTPIVRNGRKVTVGYQRCVEGLGVTAQWVSQKTMGRVLHSALPCGILKVSNKTLGDKKP